MIMVDSALLILLVQNVYISSFVSGYLKASKYNKHSTTAVSSGVKQF
jgi:hypothetical protein